MKKLWITLSVVLALITGLTWLALACAEETVDGEWHGTYIGIGGESLVFFMMLAQDGEKVTGTYSNPSGANRAVLNEEVGGAFKDGELVMGRFKGAVTGDTMVGTFPSTAGPIRNFTAKRVARFARPLLDIVRADEDPFAALEATWEGYWEWDPYFLIKGAEDLTLVISLVRGTGSSRDVWGLMTQMRRGSPLFKNTPVAGTAELSGDTIVVKLSTTWSQKVTLTLRGDFLQGNGRAAPPVSSHDNRVLLKRLRSTNSELRPRQSKGSLVASLPPQTPIRDMQGIAGHWTGLKRRSDGLPVEVFQIYGDLRAALLVDRDFYKLDARVEDGRVSWKVRSWSGTLTLHEGGGTRVLRMVTDRSTIVDFVFDEN